jgi:RNA polymerase sigma-70 factor (ECF subfamily)
MDEPIRPVTSGELVLPVTAARAQAFEEFVLAEHGRLYSALCLITRDRHEAEDIQQEALLRVWERWDRVGTLEDPTGYLYKTALNVFRRRMRRAALALKRTMWLAPPRDDIADIETHDQVVRALSRLTARQRSCVVLTDLLDYSSEEAGKILGIRASTVRVLSSQARSSLKQAEGDGDE